LRFVDTVDFLLGHRRADVGEALARSAHDGRWLM